MHPPQHCYHLELNHHQQQQQPSSCAPESADRRRARRRRGRTAYLSPARATTASTSPQELRTRCCSSSSSCSFLVAFSILMMLSMPPSTTGPFCQAFSSIYAPVVTTSSSSARTTRSTTTTAIAAASTAAATTINEPTAILHQQTVPGVRLAAYEDVDEDEDDDIEYFEESLSGFLNLQESTGSEVLQSDLQARIDDASGKKSPGTFLESESQGDEESASSSNPTTLTEKIAMASVTEQLPQRAVRALSSNGASDNKKKATTNNNKKSRRRERDGLNEVAEGHRVSHEQEIALARMIQKGTELQSLRKELQEENGDGRSIPSKQEWAAKAGLTSVELRRQISNYRIAKHQLVTANMGLVHAVVNQQYYKLRASNSGVSKEELIQEGSMGLIRAAELYDPSRGLRFSTYAVVWIKGMLSNTHAVDGLVKLPNREKTKYNKIIKAQRDIQELDGGDKDEHPQHSAHQSPERVAQLTGMSVEQVMATQRRMSRAQRVLSLDYAVETQSRSGAESGQLNTLEKDKAMQADVDLAERTQMRADVIAAMTRNLNDREARLMRLRYGLNDGRSRSLHECAEAMGISYTRVHQISTRCLKKLREAADVEALEEYLLTIV